MGGNEKYLGNPLIINRNKNPSFRNLLPKIKCRIMLWKTPLLSQARRSTLIKIITSPIPVYNMPVPKFPSKISNTIDKLFGSFFCGDSAEKIEITPH